MDRLCEKLREVALMVDEGLLSAEEARRTTWLPASQLISS